MHSVILLLVIAVILLAVNYVSNSKQAKNETLYKMFNNGDIDQQTFGKYLSRRLGKKDMLIEMRGNGEISESVIRKYWD